MKKLKTALHRTLRWSEQYIKTDMVYLTKGMSWITLGQVVSSIASFATAIAFANLISPDLYGHYQYALSVFNLLAIFTLTGLTTSLTRAAAHNRDTSLVHAFKTRLGWGLTGGAIGMCVALYYFIRGNEPLAWSMTIVAGAVPLFYAFELYIFFLRGKKLFKEASLYASISSVLPIACLIGTLFLTNQIPLLLLSYFVPYIAMHILFFRHTLRTHVHNTETDSQLIRYGKHLSVMGILGTLSVNIDKFLLWHFVGAHQLALYAFAIAPVKQLDGLISGVQHVIFPKLATHDIAHIKRMVWGKMRWLFLAIGFLVILYIVCAPFMYALLFPQYMESVLFSQIFALVLLFIPIKIFLEDTFTTHAKVREKYVIGITSAVIKIALLLSLVPFYGIWGALISYLVARIVMASITTILFIRLQN